MCQGSQGKAFNRTARNNIKPTATIPLLVILAIVSSTLAANPRTNTDQVNLLVVGDVGYSPDPKVSPNTRIVAKTLANYVRSNTARFDAILVPGDVFKVKLTSTKDEAFRKGFEEMYDPRILDMPFYAILGNHDYDAPASAVELCYSTRNPESRWKMPARWYRVDLPAQSPLLTIFMLDSNKDKMPAQDWKAQIKWLQDELAKPRAAWTICCAHKPAFSDGAHGDSGTVQTQFGPLLKKHHVDFYLSGHDHVLEHLQPDGWTTTFIISGGGGENTERPVNGHKAIFSAATPGFVHLQFNAQSAKAFFIDSKSNLLYSFQQSKNGRRQQALPPAAAN